MSPPAASPGVSSRDPILGPLLSFRDLAESDCASRDPWCRSREGEACLGKWRRPQPSRPASYMLNDVVKVDSWFYLLKDHYDWKCLKLPAVSGMNLFEAVMVLVTFIALRMGAGQPSPEVWRMEVIICGRGGTGQRSPCQIYSSTCKLSPAKSILALASCPLPNIFCMCFKPSPMLLHCNYNSSKLASFDISEHLQVVPCQIYSSTCKLSPAKSILYVFPAFTDSTCKLSPAKSILALASCPLPNLFYCGSIYPSSEK
ncbi:hypothetical protein OPV22_012299 [Ensete ventricosum]|uniref:Uncharacterized protein n=1 Tax=Ensete ventricosum TaxID=4639 RepID=A0AAV8QYH7_ENSVE|nr:hypothetical protein OPV22_012299 [Ensete ventricosum]